MQVRILSAAMRVNNKSLVHPRGALFVCLKYVQKKKLPIGSREHISAASCVLWVYGVYIVDPGTCGDSCGGDQLRLLRVSQPERTGRHYGRYGRVFCDGLRVRHGAVIGSHKCMGRWDPLDVKESNPWNSISEDTNKGNLIMF